MSVKHMYRFQQQRNGERTETITTESFEGLTLEDCNEKASIRGRELKAQPSRQWDRVTVYRIVTPAVEEKTAFVWESQKMFDDDHSL